MRYIYQPQLTEKFFTKEGFDSTTTYKVLLDTIRKYYASLATDYPDLKEKIYNREIILVPIAVDEDTGEVINILDGSPHFVTEGEVIPDMPPGKS